MELEGEDGSKFPLESGDKALFGRGSGFNTDDHTVSRRHVSFQLDDSESEAPRVSFQVIGTNPIWVLKNNDGTLKLFNKFDKGQLELGDRFCLSGKSPFWFKLNKAQVSETEIDFDQLDLSQIDPVKEFGFLVMRHEFDRYPKGMIRNVQNWKWFIEEPSKESEDEDEDDFEGMRKTKGKRKVFKDNEDNEWTGDSEDDKDLVAKTGKGKKPLYFTRSKDKKGGAKRKKISSLDKNVEEEEEDDDNDDDDDETLGGFIVTDEEDGEEEQDNDEDEEEEEEFEEEDDD